MAADPRLIKVVHRLNARFDADSEQWRATDDPEAFLLSLANGGIVIDKLGTTGAYVVRVLDKDAHQIESLLGRPDDPDPDSAEWAKELVELWNKVRRRVSKVDQTIDALLDELD